MAQTPARNSGSLKHSVKNPNSGRQKLITRRIKHQHPKPPLDKSSFDKSNLYSTETFFYPKPASEKTIHEIADDLYAWSQNEEVICISQYFAERSIARDLYYNWVAQYPYFKEKLETAKYIIGKRRERKALTGEYNAGVVLATMPLHDPRS